MTKLSILYQQVDALKPRTNNPRTHSDKQIKQLKSCITRFKFTNPVLVDDNNIIIAGHGRLLAAKELGFTEVPTVRLSGMSEAEIRAYVIADNKLAENAGWDEKLLGIEFQYLAELDIDFDVSITGFELPEIDAFIDKLSLDGEEQDPADEPEDLLPDKTVTKPGDVWIIGNHRLICGDSLKEETYMLERSLSADFQSLSSSSLRNCCSVLFIGAVLFALFDPFLDVFFVNLQDAASDFSSQAGKQLEVLKSEIAEGVDTATPVGRERVKKAVETARAYANQKTRGITVFEAWAALKDAADNEEFKKLSASINSARATLATAISWHNKQQADTKFRLKALAAQSYIMQHEHNENTDCPLCLSALSTEEQKKLAAELAELKNQAVSAERKIDDVCRSIEAELTALLPSAIKQHRDTLVTMNPKESFSEAVLQRFSEDSPFNDVLTGVAGCAKRIVAAQKALLPQFTYAQFQNDTQEPESSQNLRRTMHSLERLDALVTWWGSNREAFVSAWSAVLGKKQEDGTYDPESIEGQLAILEQALAKAEPLDTLSKKLSAAADAAAYWACINKEQELREKIAKALEPLKELRNLVGAETASSIARLSMRIKDILDRIHLREN